MTYSSAAILKVLFLSFLIVSFTQAQDEKEKTQQKVKVQPKYTTSSHKNLNNVITELADKLLKYNKLSGYTDQIAITSFVDLHQLNKTTHFGRTLSEVFFDELFARGFNVSDFRGQETIAINQKGEYFLTRNIELLDKDIQTPYVLVGTYSYFEGKMLINARVMDNRTGRIVASARSNYITNNCELTESCRKINIIAHKQNPSTKHENKKSNLAIVDHKEYKQSFIKRKNPYKKQSESEITKTDNTESMKYCENTIPDTLSATDMTEFLINTSMSAANCNKSKNNPKVSHKEIKQRKISNKPSQNYNVSLIK
jgi:TolB-like protein